MKFEKIQTARLVPYARNARTHSEAQVAQIAASIKEFGFLSPIVVDGDYGIMAGHGRVLAARMLGLETVPCVRADHLTENQKRAYIIADNRLAETSEWDQKMLALELEDLRLDGFDIDLTGFSADALDALMDGGESDRYFDGGEPPNDENKPAKKTDDNYSSFELVLRYENKLRLLQVIGRIKQEHNIVSTEDAFMVMVNGYE
jgi:ParB-like chromosome segregation protein Spo0J